MAAYNGFAYIYDLLMSGVPYDKWVAYIDKTLQAHLNKPRSECIVVDMACGTGNITFPLADMGYNMIGVDTSVDMLSQAYAKMGDAPVLFLAQDMRKLDLYGTVDAIVSVCDGLNYVLDESGLKETFDKVKLFLNPGGVFMFDMNTVYKFKEQLKDNIFTVETEGISYEWDNNYNEETQINEYRVLFKMANGDEFEEIHHQRAYHTDVVCALLHDAGFNHVRVRDDYTDMDVKPDSMRAVYIAS